MCSTPYDDHYNAFGGLVERQDRVGGRVGSILSDPALQYPDSEGVLDGATEQDLYPMEMEQPQTESADPALPPPETEAETEGETDVDAGS